MPGHTSCPQRHRKMSHGKNVPSGASHNSPELTIMSKDVLNYSKLSYTEAQCSKALSEDPCIHPLALHLTTTSQTTLDCPMICQNIPRYTKMSTEMPGRPRMSKITSQCPREQQDTHSTMKATQAQAIGLQGCP